MSRVSAQTMEQVAIELLMAHGGQEWDNVSLEVKDRYIALAFKATRICRLPIEVELRKRLVSKEGLKAAVFQIEEELPGDFEWEDDVSTGQVFVGAVMASLSATGPAAIE